MIRNAFTKWALTAAAGVLALSAGVLAQKKQITGAGATFPYPSYSKWFSEYNKLHPDVEINYQSIGSGGGIRQVTNQTVFFGASDGPMTNDQLTAAPGKILHFPTVLGSVVPVYNVPGAPADLKFTGALLADIYLGKITKWNDGAIAKVNPGVTLPDVDITTVHRSDGSGTTYIWVDYLSKISPEWKQKVGVATSVNWPNGLGGAKNAHLVGRRSALVQCHPGRRPEADEIAAHRHAAGIDQPIRRQDPAQADQRGDGEDDERVIGQPPPGDPCARTHGRRQRSNRDHPAFGHVCHPVLRCRPFSAGAPAIAN